MTAIILPTGLQPRQATSAEIRQRIARIFEECQTPLGWACRGVASWEYEQLAALVERYPSPLTREEMYLLTRIEQQVFGIGA